MNEPQLGIIVILNGAPRSGKSSIVRAIQETFRGVWINLGVDVSVKYMTPTQFRPGIGLRPGGERPDLEPLIEVMYSALYESAAAHSRLGLNVVMDIGHHDAYSTPRHIVSRCATRLAGLPAVLIGVRCPIETVLERRNAADESYVRSMLDDPLPLPIVRWQEEVHNPGIYDFEVDTSTATPLELAQQVGQFLAAGIPEPTALQRLALLGA